MHAFSHLIEQNVKRCWRSSWKIVQLRTCGHLRKNNLFTGCFRDQDMYRISWVKDDWSSLRRTCGNTWATRVQRNGCFLFSNDKCTRSIILLNKMWNGVEDRHGKLYSCEHVVTYVRTICLLAASVTKTCIEYHEGKLIASELDTCRWKSRPKNSRSPPKSRPMVNPLKNQQIKNKTELDSS